MPITMAQEMGGWSASISHSIKQFENALEEIQELAIGGTAVGTGVNSHPDVGIRACELMNKKTGLNFKPSSDLFHALSSQDRSL